MNKQHEELALEEWAKLKGYHTSKHKDTGRLMIFYLNSSHTMPRPSIDHPFMHSLIKGLDDKGMAGDLSHFNFYLWRIVTNHPNESYEGFAIDMALESDSAIQAILTASVENLLTAYFETMKGGE